jgi:hypothetical protein
MTTMPRLRSATLSIKTAKMHPSITSERVIEAVRRQMFDLDNPGFCTECGSEQGGCEPDMRCGECEACGERKVYGAEELMMSLELDVKLD